MRSKLIALLAAALSIGAIQVASAAKKEKPVKPPVIMDPGWTGFYVGGNAGYSLGAWTATSLAVSVTGTDHPKVDGFIGGGQVGYNWQVNRNWLLGIEGDLQWSDEKASVGFVFPIIIGDARSGFNIRNDWKFLWFGTGRARLGYIPDPNWLVYATGGVAIGRVQDTLSLSFGAVSASQSDAITKTGWTAGGGVETKLGGVNSHWTGKVEYIYIDLGTASLFLNAIPTQIRDHIGRVGINYKF